MDKWRIFGAAVVGALVVSGVLGGCDPGGEPVVTETPSASASASAVVTPTPSASASATGTDWVIEQLPKDALYPDLGGAIKTAEFFLSQYAPMFHSGDTRLWDAMSGPECGYCADASANAREVSKRGWVAEGGVIHPSVDVLKSHVAADGNAYIYLPSHLDDAVLVKDAGTPEVSEEASDQVFIIKLSLEDDLWRVQGVKFEDS